MILFYDIKYIYDWQRKKKKTINIKLKIHIQTWKKGLKCQEKIKINMFAKIKFFYSVSS
jgi:hypothetical protein